MVYYLASKIVSINLFATDGNLTEFSNERFPVKITTSFQVSIWEGQQTQTIAACKYYYFGGDANCAS